MRFATGSFSADVHGSFKGCVPVLYSTAFLAYAVYDCSCGFVNALCHLELPCVMDHAQISVSMSWSSTDLGFISLARQCAEYVHPFG